MIGAIKGDTRSLDYFSYCGLSACTGGIKLGLVSKTL